MMTLISDCSEAAIETLLGRVLKTIAMNQSQRFYVQDERDVEEFDELWNELVTALGAQLFKVIWFWL